MKEARDQTAAAIAAASRALVAMAARSIDGAPVEVTLSQHRALVVLATRGNQRMSALADLLGLSASSTSRLVERLERKGLVARRPSPNSRREVQLELTDAGALLVENVAEQRQREIAVVLEQVPPEQWPILLGAFEAFAVAAGEPLALPTGALRGG